MEGLLVRFQRRDLGQGLQRAAAAGPNLGGAVGRLVARPQPVVKGVLYLVAQVVGALLAAKVAPSIGDLSSYSAGRPVGEFVGAGLLILTVVAVSDKWVPKAGGGVAIGAALGAGLLLTHGVLNPAVALAMGLGRSPALWAAALGACLRGALRPALGQAGGAEAPGRGGPRGGTRAATGAATGAGPRTTTRCSGVSPQHAGHLCRTDPPRDGATRTTRHGTLHENPAPRVHTLAMVSGCRSVQPQATATGTPGAQHATGER